MKVFSKKAFFGTAVLLFFLCWSSILSAQEFLHRDGQNIVDANGNPVLLRGLGLGGWMVQEGYMLKTGDFAGPQHVIRKKITELIGEENTAKFYKAYKTNGITKRDIDSLAAWGFNSVRLPMHYNLYTLPIEQERVAGENTWLEEGFSMTDSLLNWCAANKMYLILDLHAAPGGQGKDANISDYDETKPSLWENKANQDKMIAFWKKIALRYKNEPWIGGYDIINEPNWNFSGTNKNGCDETLNAPLRTLQMEITKAIREVDQKHLIIIEGNCWGNNYKGIFPLWDENMALSFHKYWNYNDQGSIQQMLDYRKEHNVPIWLGESGENSNVWFRDVISLIEKNNIGWAFWPMKKIDNIAGVTSVVKTSGYDKLLNYWEKGTEKPSSEEAFTILMKMAENYKMENVIVKRDVIDAMFRQIQSTETNPFKKVSLPGIVFATHFDLGTHGFAYSDNDTANYWVSSGKSTEWNKGHQMRNDAVDIIQCNDNKTNGFAVGFIEKDEWLQYTVEVVKSNKYEVAIRYSNEKATGKLYLADEKGNPISEPIALPFSGSGNEWKTVTLKNVQLQKGIQKIRIYFVEGDFNLNYFEFKSQTK
ncbi:cellulase family glycosylhydrolase [Flavobacterium sp.]|uniref:cellulase family glycosylhydrolase n=1 Tax=Flavobacterium sp. TaxID=239 RepID=UPI002B4B69B4|nr:cellulase family glycosylhydrolase [Flavobacterium sp.]HLP65461.1 cellulase family glycosylhydrolase [Flavobacterium sp.]